MTIAEPSFDGRREAQMHELQRAFQTFTHATEALEKEYRTLQDQVQALRRELAEKNRALVASIERQRKLEAQALRQSRLAAMGEMAATLAHEVRNPLGAMQLFVRTLQEEVSSQPVATRLAEQIEHGVAELDHLVTNILDYTRLPEPRLAVLALDDVVDEALATAAPGFGDGVRLVRGRAAGVQAAVDRGLLIQALLNLLRNAAEAIGERGELSVAVEAGSDAVRIVVSDDGPGVPAGQEETIFAPFFTTRERGTGRGLAVTRAAVLAHGGTVALEPSARGARFVITLPSTAATSTATLSRSAATAGF